MLAGLRGRDPRAPRRLALAGRVGRDHDHARGADLPARAPGHLGAAAANPGRRCRSPCSRVELRAGLCERMGHDGPSRPARPLQVPRRRRRRPRGSSAPQRRLAQLRLTLGGQLANGGSAGSGRRCWSCSRAGTRPARAERSSASSRRSIRGTCASSSFAAPTPDEKRHHFLWRFWPKIPGWGGMAVFDRTWYGRVLVERVEGFATREEWMRAYGEINDHERSLAAEGMILVKLWLHISDEEQLKRFESRAEGPAEELEADRRGLAQPREARLPTPRRSRTCSLAPTSRTRRWDLIEGDSKRWARVARAGDGDRADRGGDARVGDRAPGAARGGRRRLSEGGGRRWS